MHSLTISYTSEYNEYFLLIYASHVSNRLPVQRRCSLSKHLLNYVELNDPIFAFLQVAMKIVKFRVGT